MITKYELREGLTGGQNFDKRHEYIVPATEVKAGRCVRYLEVSANGLFGNPDLRGPKYGVPDDTRYYEVCVAQLC